MKEILNKSMKRSLGLLLIAMFILAVIPSVGYAWDPDSIIVQQEIKGVPLGEYRYNQLGNNPSETVSKSTIEFRPVAGAKYSVVSSNNNILKVSMGEMFPEGWDSTGGYNLARGYINMNGISPGKVTVTLKQTLNGKTTTVGNSAITVVSPYLTAIGNYKHNYPLGTEDNVTALVIENRNLNSKYTFESDKEGLKVEEIVDEHTGNIYISLIATKSGVYNVIAKETLNGVTKVMKTVTINIHEMSIKDNITIELNYVNKGTTPFINYMSGDYKLYYEIDGISTIYEPISNWDYADVKTRTESKLYIVRELLRPLRTGVVDVKIYKISNDVTYETKSNSKVGHTNFEKEYIGTTRITIVDKLNK